MRRPPSFGRPCSTASFAITGIDGRLRRRPLPAACYEREASGYRTPMAQPPAMQIDLDTIYQVVIETDRGSITMELDPKLAPNTVNNFISLARDGYYDGLTFHRVVPEFVIQGGDPEGSGTRRARLQVRGRAREGRVHPRRRRDGQLPGPNTNGSQFFICIDDCRRKLQPLYNLFGYVIDGIDVAQDIEQGDVMQSLTITERATD